MAAATDSELPAGWFEKYESFNKLREQGFKQIDRGLKLEHEKKRQEAIASYELGLATIDKALNVYLENVPHTYWDQYYENVLKMKKTRKEVLSRLTDLENPGVSLSAQEFVPVAPAEQPTAPNAPLLTPPACPPSYEEAMSIDSNGTSPYAHLNNTLIAMRAAEGTLLYSQENVRVYFISPDGQVGSLSSPSTLTITQYEDGSQSEPKYFLQVGDWVYPLLPGVSPVLQSEFGAFIIPDVHSPIEGSAVGLILPDDSTNSVYEILNDILQGIRQQVQLRERRAAPPRPPPPTVTTSDQTLSQRISQGIVLGAQYLSYGLVKGAEKAGEFINTNTPKVMAKIEPAPEPQPVPPTVSKSMKVAKDVTGTAVQVTGYIAGKIGSATMALGRMVAPTIQAQGTKLLSKMSGISEQDAAGKVDGALEVTAGAVQGVGTIYNALENSASILATSLANNTVQIVQHKYGQPAGEVTGDTLQTVGNAALATYTASSLTVKGIAKRTAKNAGKAVIEDYCSKQTKPKQFDDKDGAGPSTDKKS